MWVTKNCMVKAGKTFEETAMNLQKIGQIKFIFLS